VEGLLDNHYVRAVVGPQAEVVRVVEERSERFHSLVPEIEPVAVKKLGENHAVEGTDRCESCQEHLMATPF